MDKIQILSQKIRDLLPVVRYLDPEDIFSIENALNSGQVTEEILNNIYESLVEFKEEQETAYQEFKDDVYRILTIQQVNNKNF